MTKEKQHFFFLSTSTKWTSDNYFAIDLTAFSSPLRQLAAWSRRADAAAGIDRASGDAAGVTTGVSIITHPSR